MAGFPPIAAVTAGLQSLRLETALQAATLRKQVEVTETLGDLAIALIGSATVVPASAPQGVDVRV